MNKLSCTAPAGQLPMLWSDAWLAELARLAASPAPNTNSVEAAVAAACLKAAAGDFDAAEAAVLGVMRERPDPAQAHDGFFFQILMALCVVQRFDLAGDLLRSRFDLGCAVDLCVAELGPGHAELGWTVSLPERMCLTFGPLLYSGHYTRGQILSLFRLFPLFAAYAKHWPGENGSVTVNLADIGSSPGLSLCDNRADYFLIPDTSFVEFAWL